MKKKIKKKKKEGELATHANKAEATVCKKKKNKKVDGRGRSLGKG